VSPRKRDDRDLERNGAAEVAARVIAASRVALSGKQVKGEKRNTESEREREREREEERGLCR